MSNGFWSNLFNFYWIVSSVIMCFMLGRAYIMEKKYEMLLLFIPMGIGGAWIVSCVAIVLTFVFMIMLHIITGGGYSWIFE